ncbi:hypothetical protein ONE63_005147 [Megalurothrips usitatus]|uniref:Uncharacterized protein n=1 Tax=Megalurothrips usitatus TaxID=439358 RepID=A0AAV7XXY2_9NEOP|nr:hypothetical protein ONE63_005147 [Megalurothrips usitatus]
MEQLTLHLSRLDCVTSKYTEDRPTPLLADVDRRPTQVLLTYALPYVSQVFSHIQVLCVPCDVNLSRAATAQISGMTTVYVYVLGLLPEMEYNCIAKYFNSGSKYFNSGPNTSSECNGGQTVPANMSPETREVRDMHFQE